jgi:hypothetical protein
MKLSSITSLGFGLVIRISLPLILTTRNYNNYQTEYRLILITFINVYDFLTNLLTPQIAATSYPFLGILFTYIYALYALVTVTVYSDSLTVRLK